MIKGKNIFIGNCDDYKLFDKGVLQPQKFIYQSSNCI